jgi:pimeloyl-CoA synthetase
MVQVEVNQISLYDLEGSVEDAIVALQREVVNYPGARLVKEYGRYNGDSDYLAVKIERLENDAEYVARLEQERQHAAAQEERDRQQFLRLKAKFEGA